MGLASFYLLLLVGTACSAVPTQDSTTHLATSLSSQYSSHRIRARSPVQKSLSALDSVPKSTTSTKPQPGEQRSKAAGTRPSANTLVDHTSEESLTIADLNLISKVWQDVAENRWRYWDQGSDMQMPRLYEEAKEADQKVLQIEEKAKKLQKLQPHAKASVPSASADIMSDIAEIRLVLAEARSLLEMAHRNARSSVEFYQSSNTRRLWYNAWNVETKYQSWVTALERMYDMRVRTLEERLQKLEERKSS